MTEDGNDNEIDDQANADEAELNVKYDVICFCTISVCVVVKVDEVRATFVVPFRASVHGEEGQHDCERVCRSCLIRMICSCFFYTLNV